MKERVRFDEDFSISTTLVDGWFSADFTLTSSSAVTAFSGLDWNPTIKPSVGQLLSIAPAMWSRPTITHTAGVSDVATYYAGIYSTPNINPDYPSGSLTVGEVSGFLTAPRLLNTTGAATTIPKWRSFDSYAH